MNFSTQRKTIASFSSSNITAATAILTWRHGQVEVPTDSGSNATVLLSDASGHVRMNLSEDATNAIVSGLAAGTHYVFTISLTYQDGFGGGSTSITLTTAGASSGETGGGTTRGGGAGNAGPGSPRPLVIRPNPSAWTHWGPARCSPW